MSSKYVKDLKWTAEQEQFCRIHIDDFTWVELTTALNKEFGINRSYDSVTTHCLKQMKIKKSVKRNRYKIGRKDFNAYPIGTEVFTNGNVFVKIANDYYSKNTTKPTASKMNKNWRKKSELVWEKSHGKVPDGKLIVFLDKNHKNCEINNLYVVDRKINFMMAKNKWYSECPELTLAAIKWCELYYTLKGSD